MSAISKSAMRKFQRRKAINFMALVLSLAAMVFGLVWLFWIIWETVDKGLAGLNLAVFSEMTPPPNEEGGLANAIYGSLVVVAGATLLGTPIGVMAGVYMVEYGKGRWLAQATEFVNDILLSAPSIVLGLFVYSVAVAPFKAFSAYAGIVALALIVIPVVIRTTTSMLDLIPQGLREAAYALGTPKWKVISKITIRSALAGILTGILLAVARIAGETAPLLFTALNNQFWSSDLSQPMATLPVTIFKFAMSPYENWQHLAWAGIFIITFAVLGLNILARVLTRKVNK
jgi:phosphate transport system permease protein